MADEKKPRGRPKVNETSTSVSTWVPASTHDRLIQLARQQDKTVSALVRDWLALKAR